jgi:hypothetical protein
MHQYSDWKYFAEGMCKQESFCSHCGKREVSVERHIPATEEYDRFAPVNVTQCTRCGVQLAIPEPETPPETASDEDESWAWKWVYW